MQKAAKARAPAAHGFAGQLKIGKARKKFSECDPRFKSREIHSGASMDAERKGDMPVWITRKVELVRIMELRRVPVGGADA